MRFVRRLSIAAAAAVGLICSIPTHAAAQPFAGEGAQSFYGGRAHYVPVPESGFDGHGPRYYYVYYPPMTYPPQYCPAPRLEYAPYRLDYSTYAQQSPYYSPVGTMGMPSAVQPIAPNEGGPYFPNP
jgi:hypothetical protein